MNYKEYTTSTFYKGYKIYHNWYKKGFYITRGMTKLKGFISREKAKQFIKEYL